jgi:hypothetical protein
VSTTRRSRVNWLWIAIALLGGVAIVGCGSTGASSAANSVPPRYAFQFSRCMRGHGVPNFPDPGPTGYRFTPGSGITQSPAFNGALDACEKYLPPSGHLPPTPESVRLEEIALAKCMRAHGVPNFPDPDANGDIQFPVSSPIPRSPAFQRAQNGPCKKYLSR